MKPDPMDSVRMTSFSLPASRGPGSGKDAWVSAAMRLADANDTAWQIVDQQSATIRDLQAEVELLRAQIAERKPGGGRPALEDRRVAEIERDLAAGYSTRQIAVRCAVSAMTVSRVTARMRARDQGAGGKTQ